MYVDVQPPPRASCALPKPRCRGFVEKKTTPNKNNTQSTQSPRPHQALVEHTTKVHKRLGPTAGP